MKPKVLVLYRQERDRELFEGVKGVEVVFEQAVFKYGFGRRVEELLIKHANIDGVMGLSDSASVLVSVVAEKLDLRGANPEAIFKAQNKVEFAKLMRMLDKDFPETELLTRDAVPEMAWPVFVRPAKGYFSRGARKIGNQEEWLKYTKTIRPLGNDIAGEWYEEFFGIFDKYKKELVVQPVVVGRQFTVDGWVCDGKVELKGITESVMDKNRVSFLRFDYPAEMDNKIVEELWVKVVKLISRLGFDNSAFNCEFMVTRGKGVVVIELNTRASSQFVPMFDWVDGGSYVGDLVDLALGREPVIRRPTKRVSCVIVRVPEDRVVVRCLTESELGELRDNYGVFKIDYMVSVGKKLSGVVQDEYSYRFAGVYVDGDGDIERKDAEIRGYMERCLG